MKMLQDITYEFWKRYKANLWYQDKHGNAQKRTIKEAWLMAEEWMNDTYGFYLYDNYESARQALYYHNKKKRGKAVSKKKKKDRETLKCFNGLYVQLSLFD